MGKLAKIQWAVRPLTSAATIWLCLSASGAELPAVAQFHKEVQPILKEFCYDCHGEGERKGAVAFDELKSDEALLDHDLWFKALKNVRAGLMPPQKKPRPSLEQQQTLEHWIKYAAFGIDPKNPDPGRVTVRRLNRIEYRNTIHDLMGIDFNTDVEFPPDDTGYGFDNIGDVLTVSPMLLEKYIAAAKSIVAEAMPTVPRIVPERVIGGRRFQAEANDAVSGGGGRGRGNNNRKEDMLSLSYEQPAAVATTFEAPHPGSYHLTVDLAVKGPFNFDPATCLVAFKADGRELLRKEFGWQDNKAFRLEFDQQWERGDHSLTFDLQPLEPTDRETNSLQMRIVSVTVRGPMAKEFWVKPANYDRFFPRDVPATSAQRRQYARELLGGFAKKAFRRPVDRKTIDRLGALAESIYTQPGKTFEIGVAHATAAVLASPLFLFRMEEAEGLAPKTGKPGPPGRMPPSTAVGTPAATANVDEYSLASRLSYFLWSTMPDAELFRLAERGELRKNLPAQVQRMLEDSRSESLVENFTGQWLQTRDVDGITVNARVILARDRGTEREMRQQQEAFQAFQAARQAERAAGQTNQAANSFTNFFANIDGQTNGFAGTNRFGRGRGFGFNRNGRFGQPRVQLDGETRTAMKRETQMAFSSIMHEDRSVTELIDSDYTFLNQKLAAYYGLTNVSVTGTEMRRVTLPPNSPRGGILTHGSVLLVTSNPDRTSPVKRGLFILSNILGTPAPPPPGNVPALEVAEKDFKGHDPTLRESLALHREAALCASCHSRMDPLGLAFENFNAMGLWREQERNQAIDAAGKLITGESFTSVRELKHILTNERRSDFYRCLTEKLLTYALGRGLEFYDMETVDQIVQRLQQGNGRFLPLLNGIIESAPFQKMRMEATPTASNSSDQLEGHGAIKRVATNERNL